jgi:hypothetical protein
VTPCEGVVNRGITAALPPPHRDDTPLPENRAMTTDHDTQKGTVMTVHTAHPGHHRISTTTAGIALAGTLLAVGAGYGVANLVLDEAPASVIEPENTGLVGNPDVKPQQFPGTDREERALMHRN